MNILKAKSMALDLMKKHGLEDWTFQLSTARRRYGVCMLRVKTIKLSAPLAILNSEESVRDTILHEIAHALVGRGHGHDRIWQAKALEIGCDGKARYGDEVIVPAKRFVGECPHCHHKYYRDRIRRSSCSKCSKQFNPEYLLVWGKNPNI